MPEVTEPLSDAVDRFEFSEGVQGFILAYPTFNRLLNRMKQEVGEVYSLIETQVRTMGCFSSPSYLTGAAGPFRVWRDAWRNDVRPGCPWIHLEFGLHLQLCKADTRLNIEGERIVPQSVVIDVANHLADRLTAELPGFPQKGLGWRVYRNPKGKNVFLEHLEPCPSKDFSARWLVEEALKSLEYLSQVCPHIDAVVNEMFKPD